MNEQEREQLKRDVIAAGRGPFVGWWANLYEISPETLRRVHDYLSIAENEGNISERMRHLLWVVVDSLVTHLYPRGAGVHARIAIELGASREDIIEALEIAAYVSSIGYEVGLPMIMQAAQEMGVPGVPVLDKDATREPWEQYAQAVSPRALDALTHLAHMRPAGRGLDAKTRELLYLAGYSSPAVANAVAIKRHAKRALAAGATTDELVQVLRLANCIGLHAIAEGVNAAAESLKTN